MNETVLSVENLTYTYPGHMAPALKDISFEVREKEFLGIIGPSGGGKTTLIKLILGLMKPDQGTIHVLGRSPTKAQKLIGYVPQFVTFSRDFPLTVEDVILMGRLGLSHRWLGYRREDYDVVNDLIPRLNLEGLEKRPIGNLSGGQLQRVLLARAMAGQPRILMLDEPTTNIDPLAEETIFEILSELNKSVTVLLVSHDVGFITKYVRRVVCVNQSAVCHETDELSEEAIQDIYHFGLRSIAHGDHKNGEE